MINAMQVFVGIIDSKHFAFKCHRVRLEKSQMEKKPKTHPSISFPSSNKYLFGLYFLPFASCFFSYDCA